MYNKLDTIAGFRDGYEFLSNFYPVKITVDGLTYSCVECAYQAQKTDNVHDKVAISRMFPRQAKQYGRTVRLIPNWDIKRVIIMAYLLDKKFMNSNLADLLVQTGDSYLVEANSWNDTFWGVCNGVGNNYLGQLLMNKRDVLHELLQK